MKISIGIQGGRGSFNELAITTQFSNITQEAYSISYLYTTSNVLNELQSGKINYGQFALFNNYGGLYKETVECLGKYNFEIVQTYEIPIKHCMMIHPDADIKSIAKVLSNQQVFAQCRKKIAAKFPQLQLEEPAGDLRDPANIASKIKEDESFKNVATITNQLVAEINGLSIVDTEMADHENSRSTFLLVKKR